eukprot:gnl/TRDRNA2_/TRDRNA2_50223_c0_seq1.p1 gnl/TRDRNA2_/TRDRNA2_50223_c0~~gnl/TRDRNA2_/TRDRNA2_50223_c0_seq1.p1  ORF type:complete len:229 (-),score=37.23 gnl/TRDRNA2_/TRDRNA2_50223_c0_seq1:110-796(-)
MLRGSSCAHILRGVNSAAGMDTHDFDTEHAPSSALEARGRPTSAPAGRRSSRFDPSRPRLKESVYERLARARLQAKLANIKNPHSRQRVPHEPGALGWLYAQPAQDQERATAWIKRAPKPEANLRVALRLPLMPDVPGPCPGTRSYEEYKADFLQQQEKRIKIFTHFIKHAEDHMPPTSPVMLASRERLNRLNMLQVQPPPREDSDEEEGPDGDSGAGPPTASLPGTS